MILLNIPYRLVMKGVTKWCIWWHPLRHVAKCKIEIEAIFELDKLFQKIRNIGWKDAKGTFKKMNNGQIILPFLSK